MTDPLSPELIEALMAGYVLDDLAPEEAEQFHRLLAENPDLIVEVKRLQEALDVLPYALPEVEPPPRLRESILEATATEPSWPRIPWGKILAGTAAILALLLGWDNYRLRQQLAQRQPDRNQQENQEEVIAALQQVVDVLQQPDTRVFALAGTDQATTASGSIAIAFEQKKAAIVVQNLPTTVEGKIYRLWAIIDNKKVACANFKATQAGKVLEAVTLPAAACSSANATLAVSLEPLPSPPQPVGPVVMIEKS